ncbi:TetR/AcrR family transcriptional regulator [Methylocapsa sp. S129]|uniref:TetR/AcrR family transcriptional regulator n=1 Tax=Methylocapsa sp. S129 TaxID=1641869 RepID=UPI00131AB74F|nr:TetR/AcrR family transcriptional regulator [Methylocapsa sp. S129]
MTKGLDSREKTIRAAARLFRQQGYHGTGLQDILKAAGSPRGSLYFHFPGGKEEIGVAAIAFYAEAVRAMMAAAAEASETAGRFLALVVQNMAADAERADYKEGCPIAAVALDTLGQSAALGAATRTAFQTWELEIKRGLERFGTKGKDPEAVASAVLSQLEGALLLARTYRSLEPFRHAETAVKGMVDVPHRPSRREQRA